MKKSDYAITTITRKKFVELCKKNEVDLTYLRKNNNCENYDIRLSIVSFLQKDDIAQTSIAKIFTNSFETISNQKADLAEVASYLVMRRNVSNDLRNKLKSINFEQEIKSNESEIKLKIEELEKQVERAKNDLRILQNSNLFKIDKIKKFLK